MDETDIRPTLMYLTGLKDDYEHDGRVVTEILTDPNHALSAPGVTSLGACYKQLNSSVGQFGNFTLRASTAAVESSSPGDVLFRQLNATLTGLDRVRDALALRVKGELEAAAFGNQPVIGAHGQTVACQAIIAHRGPAGSSRLSDWNRGPLPRGSGPRSCPGSWSAPPSDAAVRRCCPTGMSGRWPRQGAGCRTMDRWNPRCPPRPARTPIPAGLARS